MVTYPIFKRRWMAFDKRAQICVKRVQWQTLNKVQREMCAEWLQRNSFADFKESSSSAGLYDTWPAHICISFDSGIVMYLTCMHELTTCTVDFALQGK